MVRNLQSMKVFPRYPILFCRRKAGPGEASLMAHATKRNIGKRKINPISEPRTSIVRFQIGIRPANRGSGCAARRRDSFSTWAAAAAFEVLPGLQLGTLKGDRTPLFSSAN